MAKFADHMEKISDGVVEGYKKIEDGVVTGYKKIEDGVVEGFTGITDKMSGVMLDEEGNLKTGKVGEAVVGAYKKVEDAFVSTFMAKEGETTEEAKARVTAGTDARHQAHDNLGNPGANLQPLHPAPPGRTPADPLRHCAQESFHRLRCDPGKGRI